MISESASISLQILLNMQSEGYAGVPMNIIQYLTETFLNNGNKPINLCVTGHSLGGMLASTFALYLYEIQSQWDSKGNSNLSCISFAGPTAGNAAFATYSDNVFSAMSSPPNWDTTLGTNCDAVRCSLDVAPLFYTAGNFSSDKVSPLLTIYNKNPTTGKSGIDFSNLRNMQKAEFDGLNTVMGMMASLLTQQEYTQIVKDAPMLNGQFQPPVPPLKDGDFGGTFEAYLKAYMNEVVYQHSVSYPTLLNVPALLNPSVIVRSPAV
jgi:hypothetical protein